MNAFLCILLAASLAGLDVAIVFAVNAAFQARRNSPSGEDAARKRLYAAEDGLISAMRAEQAEQDRRNNVVRD